MKEMKFTAGGIQVPGQPIHHDTPRPLLIFRAQQHNLAIPGFIWRSKVRNPVELHLPISKDQCTTRHSLGKTQLYHHPSNCPESQHLASLLTGPH